jgi:transposase-like protein
MRKAELRWYLVFPMSYCDLAAILLDRGVTVPMTIGSSWSSAARP